MDSIACLSTTPHRDFWLDFRHSLPIHPACAYLGSQGMSKYRTEQSALTSYRRILIEKVQSSSHRIDDLLLFIAV